MQERLNCPNCGAPITSEKCEYCGTLFYDFANIKLDEVCYLRMKIGDSLYIFKAVPRNISIEQNAETAFWEENTPNIVGYTYEINLNLQVVNTSDGIIFKMLRKQGD